MFEKKPSEIRRLNAALAENPVWRNLATAVDSVVDRALNEPRWALARLRQSEVVKRGDWVDTPLGRGRVVMIRRTRTNVDTINNTYDFQDRIEVDLGQEGVVTIPVEVLHDRTTLIHGARLNGFDFFSEALQDDDYGRILDYIGRFWQMNTDDEFVKVMGYIKRMRFEMDQLWTEENGHPGEPSDQYTPLSEADEYESLEVRGGTDRPIWNSPNFTFDLTEDPGMPSYVYPTSHVQIRWNVIDHPNLDIIGVMSLFYLLAPIHLVLERVAGTVYAEETTYAGLAPQMHTIPQDYALWDQSAEINIALGNENQIHTIPQAGVGMGEAPDFDPLFNE